MARDDSRAPALARAILSSFGRRTLEEDFDALHASDLLAIADSPRKTAGVEWGAAVFQQVDGHSSLWWAESCGVVVSTRSAKPRGTATGPTRSGLARGRVVTGPTRHWSSR